MQGHHNYLGEKMTAVNSETQCILRQTATKENHVDFRVVFVIDRKSDQINRLGNESFPLWLLVRLTFKFNHTHCKLNS